MFTGRKNVFMNISRIMVVVVPLYSDNHCIHCTLYSMCGMCGMLLPVQLVMCGFLNYARTGYEYCYSCLYKL